MSSLDGVLVVDKPSGPTSHDVVTQARRALGEKRIGHTGTLDPMATGVLPLVIGRATRLARFLSGARKRYEATIVLGIETDTCDATGTVCGGARSMRPGSPLPGPAAIEDALARFRGSFPQQPPAFSAKKVGGVPAHRLARRGGEIELPPVGVTAYALAVTWVRGEAVGLSMEVSAGFYVRSLARDLGRALGCGAHLGALRRTASGEHDLSEAVPMTQLDLEAARRHLLPLGSLLPWAPAVRLTLEGETRTRHGNPIDSHHAAGDERPAGLPAGGVVRLFSADGRLVAIAEVDARAPAWPLHPSVVLT